MTPNNPIKVFPHLVINIAMFFKGTLVSLKEFENLKIFEENLKIFFKILVFDRKNIFFIKKYFSLFSLKICSILTKYEGITPKTPKVRLIFRFFSPGGDFFATLHKYRGVLATNFMNQHLSVKFELSETEIHLKISKFCNVFSKKHY